MSTGQASSILITTRAVILRVPTILSGQTGLTSSGIQPSTGIDNTLFTVY